MIIFVRNIGSVAARLPPYLLRANIGYRICPHFWALISLVSMWFMANRAVWQNLCLFHYKKTMDRTEKVKNILLKIQAEDPDSFTRFSSEHAICFTEANGDWLFPALYDFYTEEVNKPSIIELLQELGMLFHNESMKEPYSEITSLDRSLCLDESIVFEYVVKQQKLASNEIKNVEYLKTPYKTKSTVLPFRYISPIDHDRLMIEYGGFLHPYILADIAAVLVYSQKFKESFDYLRRSIEILTTFPNRYWNSELAIVGAANTFRLIRLMFPSYRLDKVDLFKKIFKYNYLYLTRMICITRDELLVQSAYVNRAELVCHRYAYMFLPLFQNPDLLYISDLYYAHFCNNTAMYNSVVSGNNYYMKSLLYYKSGSLWSNDTGGYVDIEDKVYNKIVREEKELSIINAQTFMQEIKSGLEIITSSDISTIFSLIYDEYSTDLKSFRNKTLNFENY